MAFSPPNGLGKQIQKSDFIRVRRNRPLVAADQNRGSGGFFAALLTSFGVRTKNPAGTPAFRSLRSRIAGVPAEDAAQAGERPVKNEMMVTAE